MQAMICDSAIRMVTLTESFLNDRTLLHFPPHAERQFAKKEAARRSRNQNRGA
jgi:hypothetical protein